MIENVIKTLHAQRLSQQGAQNSFYTERVASNYIPLSVKESVTEKECVTDMYHSNSYAQGLKRLFSEREGVRDNTSRSYTAMELR